MVGTAAASARPSDLIPLICHLDLRVSPHSQKKMFATRTSTTSTNPFDSFIYDDDMEDLYCSNSSGSTASLSGSVESLSSQPFDPSSPNFLDTSPPVDDYLPLTPSPSDLLFKHITPTHPSEDWQVAFSCSGGDSDMMMLGLAGESYWNGDFSTFARDDHTSFVSYDRAKNSGNRMVVDEEVSSSSTEFDGCGGAG